MFTKVQSNAKRSNILYAKALKKRLSYLLMNVNRIFFVIDNYPCYVSSKFFLRVVKV